MIIRQPDLSVESRRVLVIIRKVQVTLDSPEEI